MALAVAAPVAATVLVADGFADGIKRFWARQEIEGRVAQVMLPARGSVLRATAGPRRGVVPKAALIARPAPMRTGTRLTVSFALMIPPGIPIDSVQVVDLECATCGEGGNPGIRLYLRRGRWRVDRSKIGVRHAWSNDSAPMLVPGRWHQVVWKVTLGDEAHGATQVLLDALQVLRATGATLLPGADHADRVQIGITANSNPVPARLYLDDVTIAVR